MTEQQLRENVAQVRRRMEDAAARAGRDPKEILLCAASKTQDAATVRLAAEMDIDLFGENRVQELTEKHAANAYGSKPLHFIGHLQTNKVRQVVGLASLIQSVDSEHLLNAVNRQAEKKELCQEILLEINIGAEASKSGVSPAQLDALAQAAGQLERVRVRGLMAIPPADCTEVQTRRYFEQMRMLFERLDAQQIPNVQMDYLSMGMSGDFESAILEGANIVRVGTALFGARSYPV